MTIPVVTAACAGRARWVSRLLLLFLFVTISNCYMHVPTRLENLAVGANVRTLVSPEAARSLEHRIGYRGASVTGKLLEQTDSRLLLLVRGQGTGMQMGSSTLYQRVDVATADVLRVDVRVLSKLRTGGLVAVVAGAVTALLVQAFGESGPASVPGTPTPVE